MGKGGGNYWKRGRLEMGLTEMGGLKTGETVTGGA
jgi:hypothetical protein